MPPRTKALKVAPKNHVDTDRALKRQAMRSGFGWVHVDFALMVTAYQQCLDGGHALMLSAAAGGRGVCIRIMKGRQEPPEVEYAMDAEELNEWFASIIDFYRSSSEDPLMTMRTAIQDKVVRATTAKRAMSGISKEAAD